MNTFTREAHVIKLSHVSTWQRNEVCSVKWSCIDHISPDLFAEWGKPGQNRAFSLTAVVLRSFWWSSPAGQLVLKCPSARVLKCLNCCVHLNIWSRDYFEPASDASTSSPGLCNLFLIRVDMNGCLSVTWARLSFSPVHPSLGSTVQED